jgi:hypothetical protein
MILKIFSPKNFVNKLACLAQNKAKLCKNLIITLVFVKNANFFAENWKKLQKMVIITSTPGRAMLCNLKRQGVHCSSKQTFKKMPSEAHS